jgi:hypothetical protein
MGCASRFGRCAGKPGPRGIKKSSRRRRGSIRKGSKPRPRSTGDAHGQAGRQLLLCDQSLVVRLRPSRGGTSRSGHAGLQMHRFQPLSLRCSKPALAARQPSTTPPAVGTPRRSRARCSAPRGPRGVVAIVTHALTRSQRGRCSTPSGPRVVVGVVRHALLHSRCVLARCSAARGPRVVVAIVTHALTRSQRGRCSTPSGPRVVVGVVRHALLHSRCVLARCSAARGPRVVVTVVRHALLHSRCVLARCSAARGPTMIVTHALIRSGAC